MTRFDAGTPEERRSLVADAVEAHRERRSQFCTVEAGTPPAGRSPDDPDAAEGDEEADSGALAASEQHAWVQYSERESVLNLDCTDAEYGRITDVLASFPDFSVAEQSSPDDADGRNLRITARGDAQRIAELVEELFVDGYDYDEDVRLWAIEI